MDIGLQRPCRGAGQERIRLAGYMHMPMLKADCIVVQPAGCMAAVCTQGRWCFPEPDLPVLGSPSTRTHVFCTCEHGKGDHVARFLQRSYRGHANTSPASYLVAGTAV